MAKCFVSFLDTSGIRHQVEVEAESMYEAAALAVKVFRDHDCEPVGMNELEVEIRSSIVHILTVKKLHDWLTGGGKTPKEVALKSSLRKLIQ